MSGWLRLTNELIRMNREKREASLDPAQCSPSPGRACHYCDGTGKVRDWVTISTGKLSKCKPCAGKGVLPVKENDQAQR
jgi:hypothetical protein